VRIVLDTNVALSALLWRGTPWRLLQAIERNEALQLFTSAALLAELADVMARPVPAKRLALFGRPARELLTDYIEAVDLVTPFAIPAVVSADPDDDQVIAAAVAAHAELIVSGDRHLLDLGRHQDICIVTPAEALRLVGIP
jgi:putative PIN family toxin of toxin-antitoxin system